MGDQVLEILKNQTVAQTSRLKVARQVNHKLRGNMQALLRVIRAPIATLVGTAVYDPPSLIDGAGINTTVTVTGAALGDQATVSFSLDLQGITVTAYVSATNTVTVRFQNESTGTLDLASGTLSCYVTKPAGNVSVFGANWQNPWAGRANSVVIAGRRNVDVVSGVTQASVSDANAVSGDYTFTTPLTFAAFANFNWILVGDEFKQAPFVQGAANGGFSIANSGGFCQLAFTASTTANTGALFTYDLLGLPLELYTNGTVGVQVKNNGVLSILNTDYTIAGTTGTDGVVYTRITFIVAPTTGNTVCQPYLRAGAQMGLVFVTVLTVLAAGVNANTMNEITSRDIMWAVLAANASDTTVVVEPMISDG